MRVLVAGAGNVGRYLARILVRSGHEVTVIEADQARLARAREESGAIVVHGDATEPSLLERSGIRAIDVVAATTGDDEDNLVPQVVARVKNAMNAWLYEPDMGVDVLVSAPHTIAQLIEEQVAVGDVVQLLELAGGRAALLEATLPDQSPVVGSLVRDVAWPPDCVAAVVIRGAHVLPGPGNVVLQAGDRVLCVTDIAQMKPLHRLLGTTPPHR